MNRTEFGFERTVAAGPLEVLNCQYLPGYLIAADIERMAIAVGMSDVVKFARENLLASPGAVVIREGEVFRLPTLVPARQANGHCKFLTEEGMCRIHADAPFGCGFFDTTMPEPEANQRAQAGMLDLWTSWHEERNDGYVDLWNILNLQGRDGPEPSEQRSLLQQAAIKLRDAMSSA